MAPFTDVAATETISQQRMSAMKRMRMEFCRIVSKIIVNHPDSFCPVSLGVAPTRLLSCSGSFNMKARASRGSVRIFSP
jgi:hypothetical protein